MLEVISGIHIHKDVYIINLATENISLRKSVSQENKHIHTLIQATAIHKYIPHNTRIRKHI
jgi:hypothetical protein